MAKFYLRLPTYVAAWLRNRDEQHPVTVGESIQFSEMSQLYRLMARGLYANMQNKVSRVCFNEFQWGQMRKGVCIVAEEGYRVPFVPEGTVFPDNEVVLALSGLKPRRGGGNSEWVPIVMPRTVSMGGTTKTVNYLWQVYDDVAATMIRDLTEMAWVEFMAFAADEEAYRKENGIQRTVGDMLVRLMTKYDIPDMDYESLRKEYRRRKDDEQRYTKSMLADERTYEEHG